MAILKRWYWYRGRYQLSHGANLPSFIATENTLYIGVVTGIDLEIVTIGVSRCYESLSEAGDDADLPPHEDRSLNGDIDQDPITDQGDASVAELVKKQDVEPDIDDQTAHIGVEKLHNFAANNDLIIAKLGQAIQGLNS